MKNSIKERIINDNIKKYKTYSNILLRIKFTHIIAVIILFINVFIFTTNLASQIIQIILALAVILHDFDDTYLKKILSKNIDELNKANETLKINNANLKKLVSIDFLTNIPNRRYFFDIGEKKVHLAKRNNSLISLIFLDIDHFKKINDNYGHNTGDEVIKFIAKIISKNTRKSDIYSRIGGEEFSLILLETDLKKTKIYCNKLRKKIHDTTFIKNEIKINVTVSIGITIIKKSDNSLNDLFKRSDKALHIAKESGRNKIHEIL